MENLTRDGVALCYEEAGQGAPPVLLVHGASCDHTDMQAQFDHLRRSRRVVNLDLRGHGRSDKPQGDYSPAVLADDMAFVIRELGLHRPLVIGHSMGGVATLALAARHPDLPGGVVLLDAPMFVPAPVAEQLAPLMGAIFQPEGGLRAWSAFLESTFSPWDDPARKARILDRAASAPHHVVAAALGASLSFDAAAAARACRVPALYVRASVPADLAQFKMACPALLTAEVAGAGHFLHMEVPDQVNAMIDRFLEIVLAKRG